MKQARALTFSYNNGGQDIILGPDTISDICDSLDQAGAARALVVCGPSILRGSGVVQRVQDALAGCGKRARRTDVVGGASSSPTISVIS